MKNISEDVKCVFLIVGIISLIVVSIFALAYSVAV